MLASADERPRRRSALDPRCTSTRTFAAAREGGRTAIDDPILVVEVLSETTVKHDLTRKRLAYEAISSLRRIVYVSTDEARLDMRVRDQNGIWRDDFVESLGETLALPELGLALPLAVVYEDSEVAGATG